MRRFWLSLAVVAGLVSVANGCVNGAGDSDDASSFDAEVAEVDSTTETTASTAALTATGAAGDARSVVSAGTVEVEVDEVARAVDDAVAVVEDVGGLLFSEQSDYGEQVEARLTVKVPPAEFRVALDRLGDLGELLRQDVTTEDVTEQVVDLRSRITTSEASVVRLRDFLQDATSIDQIATLEGELLARETELETLGAQLRTVESRVAMATISVGLFEMSEAVESDADPLPGFLDGLGGGWNAVRAGASVALLVLGAVLPFALVVVPVIALARLLGWALGRRRADAPAH